MSSQWWFSWFDPHCHPGSFHFLLLIRRNGSTLVPASETPICYQLDPICQHRSYVDGPLYCGKSAFTSSPDAMPWWYFPDIPFHPYHSYCFHPVDCWSLLSLCSLAWTSLCFLPTNRDHITLMHFQADLFQWTFPLQLELRWLNPCRECNLGIIKIVCFIIF